MLTRRELLRRGLGAGGVAALLPTACAGPETHPQGVWVNDIHSGLNRTRVGRIERPSGLKELQAVVQAARQNGETISVAGGRHAMGGQQFGADTVLVDGSGLQGILEFDPDQGEVEVGAGTQWPELIEALLELQQDQERQWGIVQKQTGADRLSIAGALAANAHGRGLTYQPMVQDVEAFTLVDAQGEVHRCDRNQNRELFQLAIGGYGLFGLMASVRLRLAPRRRIEKVVEVIEASTLNERFAQRIQEGYLFGDFQYSTDLASDSLLRQGVFSCYRPTERPVPESQHALNRQNWMDLLELGHMDRGEAFRRYSSYYLGTSGQVYWSDTHQLSTYIDDYHSELGARIGPLAQGSEMISEIYVPREALTLFLEQVREDFLANGVNLIYGTIRLIERDQESFLTWARQSWVCVIFNLHTAHDEEALEETAGHFRRLIDRGRAHGGSYFLTYHRWASREQVLDCYPQFPEFLRLKLQYDPEERFQSDWYRHHKNLVNSRA